MAKLLGSVDLLGLNSFGEPVGMSPLFGMAIGGGVSGATSMILARTGKAAKADAYGFLAGLATSGVLYAMKATRHAAFGALAGAFFATGLRWLGGVLFGSASVAGVRGGVGLPMINALNGGLGMPMINALNGMGMPAISQVPPATGAIPGVAGPQISGGMGMPPINLLGQRMSAGGPQVSGLSARYGATLMSRN